jgi:hypothetical protein
MISSVYEHLKINIKMTYEVQMQKIIISSRAQPFCRERHHCSRSTLRFSKDEDKRGRASEKCRKKA